MSWSASHNPAIRSRVLTRYQYIVFLMLLWISAPGYAQSLSGLAGGSSGGPKLVEREAVEQTAARSFARFVETTVQNNEPANQDNLSSGVAAVARLFEQELGRTLDSLQGDGLLDADEVASELGDLRGRFEQEINTVISAIRDGYPPPPLRRAEQPDPAYLREISHYTLFVRNPSRSWLLFFAFILGGLFAAWASNRAATRLGERLRGDGLPGVGNVLRSVAGPLYLAAICAGLQLGFDNLWIPAAIRGVLQGSISALLVGALFWFLWNACPGIATGILRLIGKSYNQEFDAHAHNILLRVLRIIVIICLTLVIVRLILDTSLSGMLTGLGILGVGLYFILRGTVENIAASFTLFSDQPFRVGDLVIYNDEWGTIEDIGFRSTQFRTLEGFLVTIPNSELIDISIVNAGARPSIRRRFNLGLTYDTPPQKIEEAMEIIRDILTGYEGEPEDDPARVEFEKFGAYDLQLLINYYYAPPDYWQALAFDTKVNLQILERFTEAGIEIAYPTETQIIEGAGDDKPVHVTAEDEPASATESDESDQEQNEKS